MLDSPLGVALWIVVYVVSFGLAVWAGVALADRIFWR